MYLDTEAYIALGFLGVVIVVTAVLFGYIIRRQGKGR